MADNLPFVGFFGGALAGVAAAFSKAARNAIGTAFALFALGGVLWLFGLLIEGVLVAANLDEDSVSWVSPAAFCLGVVGGLVALLAGVVDAVQRFLARGSADNENADSPAVRSRPSSRKVTRSGIKFRSARAVLSSWARTRPTQEESTKMPRSKSSKSVRTQRLRGSVRRAASRITTEQYMAQIDALVAEAMASERLVRCGRWSPLRRHGAPGPRPRRGGRRGLERPRSFRGLARPGASPNFVPQPNAAARLELTPNERARRRQ